MWIQRDISKIIETNKDPIQIIRGPRQCGKTSLVLQLDPSFRELSLDDPSLRQLAQTDPELFLKQFHSEKIFIDEAQYAPALFPSLKRKVDLLKRDRNRVPQTIMRLTGSNQILMDRNVKESLAGRASYFDMNTLSIAEILRAKKISIQEILFRGGWPEIHANDFQNVKKFLDVYINTYIEKDVVLSGGIQKGSEFLKFIKLLAGRVGEILDYASLGRDVGVDSKTIKEWVSILERMHVIALVGPYVTNLSSRLIKSPKVYFIDTGLVCRLQGWTSAEPILTSPQQGHLFENLVFSELYKLNINYQLGWSIYHWRSREGEEIDFLIEKSPGDFLFLEVKVSAQKLSPLHDFPEVRKVFKGRMPLFYLCHQEGEFILDKYIPVALLKDFLIKQLPARQ